MNQNYKFRHNGSKSVDKEISNKLKEVVSQKTFEKNDLFQTNIFNQQIKNELLSSLPVSDLQNLYSLMELVQLDKDEYIYQPDNFIHYLYFPETAVISEYQILQNGKTIELSMVGREGIVGASSVLNSNCSRNWSQVLIPGQAYRIDSKAFELETNSKEAVKKIFFNFINLYISQISQKIICNNHHTIEERLCLWLLMINERCDDKNLPLTQEQIANYLGTYRPSITLITQTLRQKGIIDSRRGKIIILDEANLKKMSCDCYTMIKTNQQTA